MKLLSILSKFIFVIIFLLMSYSVVQAGCVYHLELKATLKEEGNFLTWSTKSETNSQSFLIERSSNGIDFEMAGRVDAAGTTSENNEYSFSDLNKNKMHSRYFYRLVQIDLDGTSAFSHVVVLTRNKNEKRFELTSLNSSIVDKYLNFNLKSKEKTELNYNLQTQMGEIQLKGKVELTKGDNAISLDLNDLEVGRYQFALKIKNEISVIQVKKVDSAELPAVNLANQKN